MARGRLISGSISTSESFNALSEWARLTWCMIIPHLDDFGTIEGSATKLKALTQPLSGRSTIELASAVREVIDVGILTAYEVDGRFYLRAESFDQHQVNLHKRTRSRFPEPKEGRKITGQDYENAQASRKFPEVPGDSVERRKERKNRKNFLLSEPAALDTTPVKEGKKRFADDSKEMRAAKYLLEQLKQRNPDFTTPNLHAWAEDFDGIFRLDGRDPALVADVIAFVVVSENLSQYLLSPGALRKTSAGQWKDKSYKFDTFVKAMRRGQGSNSGERARRGAGGGAAI